jgi:acetyl-CoA carboxylase carboxyl transferase subunit beta
MAWWSRKDKVLSQEDKKSIPKGIWVRCEGCQEILFGPDLEETLRVCPKCGHHFVMPTEQRIATVLDEGTWEERDVDLEPTDPLEFRDSKRYRDRLKASQRAGLTEAFRTGLGRIGGRKVSAGFFVFEFMGGSMGSVVGEKVTRLFERALDERCAAIIFNASGGARMQEGILSLMQMAKTTAALARLRTAGLPYVSVLLHPTTGGVAASFASLGDVILAEPKALIGFAGPRVIEQTIRQKLPEGFQRSEFLLEHGMLDFIVPRPELKDTLARLLGLLGPDEAPNEPGDAGAKGGGKPGNGGSSGRNGPGDGGRGGTGGGNGHGHGVAQAAPASASASATATAPGSPSNTNPA